MDDLQLTFRGIDRTPELEAHIRDRVKRLQRRCSDLTGCSVAVEVPHRHATSGSPYRVRINCELPRGHDIVVTKEEGDHPLHDDLRVVINDAFKAAERQVRETAAVRRGDVKHHEEPRAVVVRKFEQQGYGFLRDLDGREIYFHENAVAHDDFAALAVGKRADLLVLDSRSPALWKKTDDQLLDAAIFAASGGVVRDVAVGGRWVVRETRHPLREKVAGAREADAGVAAGGTVRPPLLQPRFGLILGTSYGLLPSLRSSLQDRGIRTILRNFSRYHE